MPDLKTMNPGQKTEDEITAENDFFESIKLELKGGKLTSENALEKVKSYLSGGGIDETNMPSFVAVLVNIGFKDKALLEEFFKSDLFVNSFPEEQRRNIVWATNQTKEKIEEHPSSV